MKNRLVLDFESRSACDLKKSGAYKYSLHPTTHPTCLAFKARGDDKPTLLTFEELSIPWRKYRPTFRSWWQDKIDIGFLFTAHNAFFERCIYENILVKRYGWPHIPFRQYRCTAAKAAACALPRNLEGAGETLNLAIQKDRRGYSAMMATCKPTKAWNAWVKLQEDLKSARRITEARKRQMGWLSGERHEVPEPPMFLEPKAAPDVWKTLYTYCAFDVKTEELLDETLPDLIPDEQEAWFLNQELNWNGLRVDVPTITKIVDIMEVENKKKLKELDTLTMGLVRKPGARKAILSFLAIEGIELPDIRAKTVEDVLKKGGISPDMRRLLEIRKALSKTSTKKYQSMLDRANEDERVRDILLYCGASTGRDGGTGINPTNFPRPLIWIDKNRPYAAVENVVECDAATLRMLYGEDALPIVFSSILRNMIIPSKDCELFVSDYAKIEVAVLWWLADNFAGLDVFNSGKDPYIYQAAANTGKSYEEIERAIDAGEIWAIDARQLGKAQILGAGFRMSWKRFLETAFDQYRLKLTKKQAVEAIKSYRENNPSVVELWHLYEYAAVEAIDQKGRPITVGKCIFKYDGKFLTIELPSGRKLYYLEPTILWKTTTYTVLEEDEKGNEIEVERTSKPKRTVQHLGLDLSKKKMRVEFKHGGIWTENIVQAVARDIMVHGLMQVKKKYRPLLTVYDEIICERRKGYGSEKEFETLMCTRPAWADSRLPLQAKAYKAPRYRK